MILTSNIVTKQFVVTKPVVSSVINLALACYVMLRKRGFTGVCISFFFVI